MPNSNLEGQPIFLRAPSCPSWFSFLDRSTTKDTKFHEEKPAWMELVEHYSNRGTILISNSFGHSFPVTKSRSPAES